MAKKEQKVVVNKTYFDLIERKANLLDQMVYEGDGIAVDPDSLKELAQIRRTWDKHDAYQFIGTEEPYAPKNK